MPFAKVLVDEFLRDDLEERGAKERWYLDNGNGDLLPASANALIKALTRHAAQAGIEFQGKILHGFRASLATSLANENPAVAQRILRHANISTTISHYVNLPVANTRKLREIWHFRGVGTYFLVKLPLETNFEQEKKFCVGGGQTLRSPVY